MAWDPAEVAGEKLPLVLKLQTLLPPTYGYGLSILHLCREVEGCCTRTFHPAMGSCPRISSASVISHLQSLVCWQTSTKRSCLHGCFSPRIRGTISQLCLTQPCAMPSSPTFSASWIGQEAVVGLCFLWFVCMTKPINVIILCSTCSHPLTWDRHHCARPLLPCCGLQTQRIFPFNSSCLFPLYFCLEYFTIQS